MIFRCAHQVGKSESNTMIFHEGVGLVQRKRSTVRMSHHQVGDVYIELRAVTQIGRDIPFSRPKNAIDVGNTSKAIVPDEVFANDTAYRPVRRVPDDGVDFLTAGDISKPAANSARRYQSEKLHPFLPATVY